MKSKKINKKKIIFFDVWLGGIKNYFKIKKFFHSDFYTSKLIHTSSFNDLNRQKNYGLDVKDISDYNTKYIFKVLSLEKPDYVVIFNFHTLVSQTVILSCKILKITCIFIQPGIREINKDYIKNNEYLIKFNRLNKQRRKKFKKYFFKIVPNFFYTLLFTREQFFYILFHYLKRLILVLYNPGRNLFYTKTVKIFHPDKSLVFSESHKNHFYDLYNFSKRQIFVTGNLDLYENKFFLNNHEKKTINFIKKSGKYALYLPTPFKEAGYDFWSNKFFKNFIEDVIKTLRSMNLNLVIKLHPSMDIKFYKKLLAKSKVKIIKIDNGLNQLLANSEFSICHTSSAILSSIVHTKYTFIPKWGFFSFLNDRFGSYGLTIPINSFNELKNIYLNKKKISLSNKKKYLDKLIGPRDDDLKKRILFHFK